MTTHYAMMKCIDAARREKQRVDLYFTFEHESEDVWDGLQAAAEAECDKRGWHLVVVRPVPKEICLDRLAMYAQNGES